MNKNKKAWDKLFTPCFCLFNTLYLERSTSPPDSSQRYRLATEE